MDLTDSVPLIAEVYFVANANKVLVRCLVRINNHCEYPKLCELAIYSYS